MAPSDEEVGMEASTAGAEATSFVDREASIQRSESLVGQGQFAAASRVLRQLLVSDPTDVEVLFRLAGVEADRGDMDQAIELLGSIPADHPEAGLAALGQSADWCFQQQRYHDAELRYLQVIELASEAAIARRQLAHLYNRQGRRHEAAEQIRELCRLGDVREQELHSLMSLSDGVFDEIEAPSGQSATGNIPIGASGHARVAFTKFLYSESAQLLREACADPQRPESINAFYGRAIAESQDEAWFLDWLANTTQQTQVFAEYWAGLGAYLIEQQRFPEAVRALAEALRRDTTDARSYRRLNQALTAMGKSKDAERWFERYVELRNVTLASNELAAVERPDPSQFSAVVAGLEKMDRPLESVLWQTVEAFYRHATDQEMSMLNEKRMAVASSERAFGTEADRLCGLSLEQYPLADLETLIAGRQSRAAASWASMPNELPATILTPKFSDVAGQVDLGHHYRIAANPQANRLAIYQSLGGGVAVLDFDLDGNPDLYFAQGGADPPHYISDESNSLYRSTDGRLVDVTTRSSSVEFRYSIGVTAGDWNQDGFPDLVCSNMGRNTLFLNQGDGTFHCVATDDRDDVTVVPSSLAIADVTGDALPDIIELNYAHDATIIRKPELNERGEVVVVGPLDFIPAADRILVNAPDGQRGSVPLNRSDSAKASGLGVVVANFDDQPDSEIFVGNDMAADQLWKRTAAGQWRDLAPLAGCALSSGGATNASMGIAAADFDTSGTLDLHITNFENQSATLFLNRKGTFQDRAVQFRLDQPSIPLLGFGCQPLDYDLDGRMDLMVSNGHVDDTGAVGQSFRQPPQLFVNRGDHFEQTVVQDPSGYFTTDHVGRALARLDFNRDGKPDLVVTHIEASSALLVNRTATDHHWLRLQLIGTASERDAIGATATIHLSNHSLTQWVIAGDGYLCRNEPGLVFGLGDETQVETLTVTWPDGQTNTYSHLAADRVFQIVQGESDPFELDQGR